VGAVPPRSPEVLRRWVYLRRPVTARLKELQRDERGASAVEFALLSPVLFLLAAGAIDTCRLIVQTMQVRAAAQAGADFALRRGFDATGVQNAVENATDPAAITPTGATVTNGCVSGTTITPATPGAACPGGGFAGGYVNVGAQANFTPLVPWPGLPGGKTISAQALVRVQ